MKTYLSYIFLVVFSVFQTALPLWAVHELPLQIDTPLKAAVLYFPSPSVMRCLNHSNIPRAVRKALISRQIKFPTQKELTQNVTIGIDSMKIGGSKFVIAGTILTSSEIIPLMINGGPFFDINKGRGVKPSFLFGLEDLIGTQRKIRIVDMIGNQNLDYEVFLRTTKGMIGNLNYNIDLFGEDKSLDGEIRYFLRGKGEIGKDEISVSGRELERDYYEINESYGMTQVFTSVRVYD